MKCVLKSLSLALAGLWLPTAVHANGLDGSVLWSAEGRHEARPRSSAPLLLSSTDSPLLAASGSFEDPSRIWRIDPIAVSTVEAQALEFPSGVASLVAARTCADGRTLFVANTLAGASGSLVGQLAADGTLRWIQATALAPLAGNRALFVSGTCDAIVSGGGNSGVLQVWAFDGQSGQPRWSRVVGIGPETAGLVPWDVAFTTSDAVFIRVGSSTALLKLDAATGVRQWTRQYPADTVLGQRSCPSATAAAGRGYIACWRTDETPAGSPVIAAIDASTGDIVWTAFDLGASAVGPQTPTDITVEDGITLRTGTRVVRVEAADGATRWAATLRPGAAVSTIPGGVVLVAEPPEGGEPARLSRRTSGTGAIAWARDLSSTATPSVGWAGSRAVVMTLDLIAGVQQFPVPRLALFDLDDGAPVGELQPTASVADAVGVPVAVGDDRVVARTTLSGAGAQLVVERRSGTTGAVQWSRTLTWESAAINQGLVAPVVVLDAGGVLTIATSTYPRFTDAAGVRLQSSFVVAIAATDGSVLGQAAMPPVIGAPVTRWFAVQRAEFLAPDGFVLAGAEGEFNENTGTITRQNVLKRRDAGATTDRWSTVSGNFLVEAGDLVVLDTDASQTVRWRRLDGDTGGEVWSRPGVGRSPTFSVLRSNGSGDLIAAYSAEFGAGVNSDVGMTRFAFADGTVAWHRQWAYQPNIQQDFVVGLQLDGPQSASLSVRSTRPFPSPLLWRFDTTTGDRILESVEAIPGEWVGSGGRIVRAASSEIVMSYGRWANANLQSNVCGACASAVRIVGTQAGGIQGAHFTSNAGRFELGTADLPPLLAEISAGPDALLRTTYDPVLGRRSIASALSLPAPSIVGDASVQFASVEVSDDPYATATVAIRVAFSGGAGPTRVELRGFQQAGSWVASATCTAPRNSCQLDPRTGNLSGSVELADGESAQLLVTIRQNPNSTARGVLSLAVTPPFAVLDGAPINNFASTTLQGDLLIDSFEPQ
jgi:hypothetical protein